MAITDWSSLRDSVLSYCARSDTKFTNQIENFVAQAEDRIFHGVGTQIDPLFSEPLRSDEMVTSTTVALTSGVGTVPSDSLGIRRLDRDSDRVGLDYMSPDAFAQRLAYADSGNPRWYTVEGTSIKTAPGGYTGNLNIVYYAKPTGISSSNTTNAVLTARPTLYLYATLFEAFSWMQEGDAAVGHLARYRSIVSGTNRSVNANRYGGGKIKSKPRVMIGQ